MIAPEETEIIGNWIEVNGRVVGDAACDRVESLTRHYLTKLGYSEESGGWQTLFIDPNDKRFWMRTYPHGDWHGGGPAALVRLAREDAKAKFPKLKID